MPPRCHLCAWLLLLMLTTCQQSVRSQERDTEDVSLILGTAQLRMNLGLLKKAGKSLVDRIQHIQQSQPKPPLSSGYHRLTSLLAQTHFQSKDYGQALEWAQKCKRYLDRFGDPNGELVSAKQDVAVLLAEIHEAQKQWDHAASFLDRSLQLNKTRPRGDPVWELEVLALLARVHYAAGNEDDQAKTGRYVEQAASSLKSRFNQHRIPLDAYQRGVRAFANYLAKTGQPAPAIAEWKEFLAECDPAEALRRAGVWSEIATLHRGMEQHGDELAALRGALAEQTAAKKSFPASSLDAVEYDLRMAHIYGRIAQALLDIGNESPETGVQEHDEEALAADYLEECQALYNRTIAALQDIRRRAGLANSSAVVDRVEAFEVAVQQGRLNVLNVSARLLQFDSLNGQRVTEDPKNVIRLTRNCTTFWRRKYFCPAIPASLI